MNATALHLPATATVRLHLRPGQPFPHVVVVAAAGGHPAPEDVTSVPGGMSALLTNDPGFAWPDRRGVALLAAVMERQGSALVAFSALEDALAFQTRLAREAQR